MASMPGASARKNCRGEGRRAIAPAAGHDRSSSRSCAPGPESGCVGGGSKYVAKQLWQMVWVTPAADGGAVTTHRHQAQTTVNTRASISASLSLREERRALVEVPAIGVTEGNGGAAPDVGQRAPLTDSMDCACSILERRWSKIVRRRRRGARRRRRGRLVSARSAGGARVGVGRLVRVVGAADQRT